MRPSPRGPTKGALSAVLALLLAACTTTPPPPAAEFPAPDVSPAVIAQPAPVPAPAPSTGAAWPEAAGEVLGRNDRLLIYQPVQGDRLAAVAARFIGDAAMAWAISEANGMAALQPGVPLLVPLQSLNPIGVTPDRIQVVPILCYHRFGNGGSKMVHSSAQFANQLEWLSNNGYQVIRLSALKGFLAGQRALPQKSVVITIDDGYESAHRHAFPLLRRYGFPATLFLYSDFVGAGDALRWPQLQEMAASGLIDIQSHTKTHRNLIERAPGETDISHRAKLDDEMKLPRDLIQRRLPGAQVRHIAYPFGDANAAVIDSAARHGFELGLTVVPGGNAFNSQPLLLRRTMIFGDLDLEGFKAKVQTSRRLPAP